MLLIYTIGFLRSTLEHAVHLGCSLHRSFIVACQCVCSFRVRHPIRPIRVDELSGRIFWCTSCSLCNRSSRKNWSLSLETGMWRNAGHGHNSVSALMRSVDYTDWPACLPARTLTKSSALTDGCSPFETRPSTVSELCSTSAHHRPGGHRLPLSRPLCRTERRYPPGLGGTGSTRGRGGEGTTHCNGLARIAGR
jgi:hypothetical protein